MAGNNTVEIILSARDQASAAMREAFGGMESSSNKFLGSLLSMKTLAAGALASLGGYISKTGVDYNAMVESSTVAWNTLLGSQDKAKKMLQDISTFAKNTQFGTEDVDQMAKYMNNAGLQGKALFDTLTKVSDVAGAFDIPAESAKEMARQMSQVMQSGTAYTEDLNILGDRGVPILQALSKEMGVSVSQVKNMASNGKISSDVYMKAFNDVANSVKGASATQSQTFNGMISTFKDNWQILAGTLSKPLFDFMKKEMTNLMPVMNGLVSLAQGNMKEFKQSLETALGKNGADMVLNFANNVKQGMGQISSIIDKAKTAFKGVYAIFEGDSRGGTNILEKLGFSPQLIGQIGNIVTGIKTTITTFANDAKKAFNSLFSGKNNVATSFISIFNTIKSIAMPILSDIVKFIGQEFAQIKKWWDTYGGQITEAVKNFFAVLAAIFKVLAPVLLFIIKSVWDNIKGVIDGAIKIIQGIILVFTGIFTGNWKTLWQGIKDILGGALKVIWNAIQLVFIGKLLKGIGSFFGLLKELFSGGWSSIVNGLKLFVSDTGTWFAKFLDTAKTNFDKIVDAAKNIPSGIVSGLKSGVKAIEDAIAGIATTLVDKFKKVLGIKSPSKVFTEMGGHIISGLANGLTSGNLLDLGKMVFSDFGGGIFNSLDKIKTYIKMFDSGILSKIGGNVKDFFTAIFSGGGGGNVPGNISGWISAALGITGAPSSWLGPLSTLVQHESGGDPRAINLWDSNAKAGHPSKGLFQTIDSTFASYAIKGLGDIYNPVANAVAGIRYIMDRYGSVFNVPGIKSMMGGGAYKGYASGTNDYPGGFALMGENGPELAELPKGSKIHDANKTKQLLNDGTKKVYNVTVNALKADMNENDLVRALHRMEVLNNV
jgi:tape measure domain-containing protein